MPFHTTYDYLNRLTRAREYAVSGSGGGGGGGGGTGSPDAPALTSFPGDQQVFLEWGTVAGATGYKVYRGTSTGSLSLLQVLGNVSTFTDDGLVNDSTYYYRVSATNSIGEGPQSNQVAQTPRESAGSPAAPANFRATAHYNSQAVVKHQINLAWDDDNATYDIWRRDTTDPNNEWIYITHVIYANQLEFADTNNGAGLAGNTTYEYRIRAERNNTYSLYSYVTERTFADGGSVERPIVTATASSSSSVSLSWADVSNETGYVLYRRTGTNLFLRIASLASGVTSYVDSGLSAGTLYDYVLRATQQVGTSTYVSGPSVASVETSATGPGDDTIGFYDSSTGVYYLRNSNDSGAADTFFSFGAGGTSITPIAGDWDGDGDDTIGFYDSSTGVYYLRNSNDSGAADTFFSFGAGGTSITPIAGDWDNASSREGGDRSTETSVSWEENYSYDAYGNRTDGPQIDGSKNQYVRNQGYSYDDAGNLTQDPLGVVYLYDANNKLREVQKGGITSKFVYDGTGHRVKKIVNGVASRFVYGIAGELVAEYQDGQLSKEYIYGASGILAITNGTASAETFNYLTADHLGSPRVITRGAPNNAGVVSRHDYLPFGKELLDEGARQTLDAYYPDPTNPQELDGVRNQYTAYERDSEVELDYAGARYYAYNTGRFTSPDVPLIDQSSVLPQSWNLYTYARNNPVAYIDPTGQAVSNPSFVGADVGSSNANGDEFLEEGLAKYFWRLGNTLDARAANNAIAQGDNDRAYAIVSANSSLIWAAQSAEETVATLKIISQGTAGSTSPGRGHSWVELIEDDSNGQPHSFSTYGNREKYGEVAGNGLRVDLDVNEPELFSRSTRLTISELRALRSFLIKIQNQGQDAWTLTCPCSCFAAEAWRVATGEDILRDVVTGGVVLPVDVSNGIKRSNGGKDHLFVPRVMKKPPQPPIRFHF